jgi:hypothetical protein
MQLRELQREFQRDLLGGTSAIGAAIVEAPPLPVEARLGIYRRAYRTRLTEALDDTHPILHRILGDETFASMAELFIETHPSVHRSIRWYGSELADFLTEQAPFAAEPALAEIARFEWTLCAVFDAPDATPLDRAALSSVDPGVWAALRLRFHPSIRRLALRWNVVAVWQRMSEGEEPPAPEATSAPVPWLLWWQNFKNYFRSLDAAEDAALEAAVAGRPFGEICEELGAFLPEEEIPLRAATLLAGWLDSGIIIAIEPGQEPV